MVVDAFIRKTFRMGSPVTISVEERLLARDVHRLANSSV